MHDFDNFILPFPLFLLQIYSMCATSDERFVFVGGFSTTIWVFDVHTYKLIAGLKRSLSPSLSLTHTHTHTYALKY